MVLVELRIMYFEASHVIGMYNMYWIPHVGLSHVGIGNCDCFVLPLLTTL